MAALTTGILALFRRKRRIQTNMTIHEPLTLLHSILPIVSIGFISLCSVLPEARAAESSSFAPIWIEKASVARQLELLQSICEPGQVIVRDGIPTCDSCPPYTTGGPAGLRITNTIKGNFTHHDTGELLVDASGCEPATTYGGGSILLEEGKNGWSRTLYLPGFRSNECVRFRTIRKTISLACNMSSVDQGIQRGKFKWLSLRDAKPIQHDLFEWYDNSQSNSRRLVSIFPHRFMKSDFNSDGRVDLRVTVRVRDETIPTKYPNFVGAMSAGHRFRKATSLQLMYLYDGSTLLLAPDSEATSEEINILLENTRDH